MPHILFYKYYKGFLFVQSTFLKTIFWHYCSIISVILELYLHGYLCRIHNFKPVAKYSHSPAYVNSILRTFLPAGPNIIKRGKFLIIKRTRCTNISNLFLDWNSTCFGQFLCPSSEVFHCTHSNGICHTGLLTACEQEYLLLLTSCQKTCMTHIIAVCTVKNSWWWTEELSETCRVSFQE